MFERMHCITEQPIALTLIQWWRGDIVGEDFRIIICSEDGRNVICTYCNRFDQRVARQQLRKHGSARNNRLVCVFYVVRAEQRWNNCVMKPVSKQRLGTYISGYRTVL
jgi:hypothetical protein